MNETFSNEYNMDTLPGRSDDAAIAAAIAAGAGAGLPATIGSVNAAGGVAIVIDRDVAPAYVQTPLRVYGADRADGLSEEVLAALAQSDSAAASIAAERSSNLKQIESSMLVEIATADGTPAVYTTNVLQKNPSAPHQSVAPVHIDPKSEEYCKWKYSEYKQQNDNLSYNTQNKSNGAPAGCIYYNKNKNNKRIIYVKTCKNHPNCTNGKCSGCEVL